MKTTFLALAMVAALASQAFAGDDLMQSRFGNTTVVTTAQGVVIKIWYNADHTWTGMMGTTPASGTWKLDGMQLCVSYANPPAGMVNPTCSEAQNRKVGDHWTVGEGASQMSATLVAGKQ